MKKIALLAALALALPFAVNAQTATTPASPDTKTATKVTTKTAVKPATKAIPKKALQKKQITRRAAKAVEEVTPVSNDTDVTLTDVDLAIAQHVFTGKIQCELGADVTLTADEKHPGFFTVSTKNVRYRMHPVESRTGAIRMEDPRTGAMWLQIANKSMLMNQKLGLRLADECQAPAQMAVAEEMKKNPPKNLFDGADAPSAAAK